MPKKNYYSVSKAEKGKTYDLIESALKQNLSEKEILKHWQARAQRKGIQAVMSARHAVKENIKAAELLKKEIFYFLEGHIENKNIFELGCGIGRITAELANKANHVVAIDFSSKMLKRAKNNLKKFDNVELKLGKISDFRFKPKSFDLVFDCIVLLHILNPKELRRTVKKMKYLSNIVFICEHTYEGPDFPISKYSILRKPKEYEELFKPFRLIKQKTHFCAGDRFILMLFENK